MVQNKRRIISLILMLTLLVSSLVVGVITASAEEVYQKISSESEFTTGKYVIVCENGIGLNGYNNKWVTTDTPTIENNVAQGSVWNITVDGSKAMLTDSSNQTIKPSSESGNGITTGSNYYWNWTWSGSTVTFSGSNNGVMLAYNASSNGFRAYKNSTANGYKHSFTLYKLVDAHDHSYSDATCTAAPTCSCGATNGPALGHDMAAATCLAPATCKRPNCGHTEGEIADHNFVEGVCDVCGEVDPDYVPSENGSYVLVTNHNTLSVGDKIVIVANGYDLALSTTQNTNNRGTAVITKDGNTVTLSDDVQVITLERGATGYTFAFNTGEGYLYSATTGSNTLKTKDEIDAYASWQIQIDENGVASIVASGENTNKVMQFYYASNNQLFSCYTGATQKALSIYKWVANGEEEHVHNYSVVVTDPTCEAGGYTTYTCDGCDEDFTIDSTDALGHDWNENGYCNNDGDHKLPFATLVVNGNTVEILFNANGSIELPGTVALGENDCLGGKTFVGWSTKEDNITAADIFNGTVSLTDDVTYYAIFKYETTTTIPSYNKVTTAPSNWSGTYLIVYEGGNVAFNGALTTLDASYNNVSVTINDEKIEATEALKVATFTIAKSGSGYTIQSASGYYIGQTSNSNGLASNKTTTYNNTISINSDGTVNFVSGGAYLRFNAADNNMRFRYYKSATYSGQEAICLYVLGESDVTTVTYTANLDEHDYEAVVTDPTCTEAGYTTYICSCGDTYTGDEVAALGHSYEAVVTAPTCTAAGYTTYTCACGDTYTEAGAAATGHTPGAAATCTTAQTCTVCTAELTAALGHDMVTDEAVDPTCTETGLTEGSHCSRCDHKVAQKVVPATGHSADCPHSVAVGVVGETVVYYDNIHDAVANGGTVTVLADIKLTKVIHISDVTLTLDLNGKTITADGYKTETDVCEVILVDNGANVTIIGNGGTLISGTGKDDDTTNSVLSALHNSVVTIENGTFISKNIGDVIFAKYNSTIYIKGGYYEAVNSLDGMYFVLDIDENYEGAANDESKIIVTGGTFANFNPAKHNNDGKYTNKVADGYAVTKSENNYTVISVSSLLGTPVDNVVTLDKDVDISGTVALVTGVVIDLNGKNLTVTGNLITFAAGQLIDSVGGGKIYVDQKGIVYNDTNDANVLVYNAEGYYSFKTIKKQSAQATVVDKEGNAVEGKTAIDFRPAFYEGGHYDSFADAEAAGLQMFVSITWENMPEDKVCKYEATKELLAAVYGNQTSVRLVLVNAEENVEYTITLTIVSDTGYTYTDVLGTVKNGVYTKN